MELARWIGFGSFFLASLVVGIRLVALSRRTGQLPELLIGLGVLGIGPLGFGLSILASLAASHSTILAATLMGSCFLAIFIGASSQYLFVWYVFRRQHRFAKPIVFTAIALLSASYAGDILDRGLVNRSAGGTWFWLGTALRAGVLGWSAGESLAYHARMRRRQRLGLAEPVVTNRFLLWGVGAGAAFLGSVLGAGAIAFYGFSAARIPAFSLVMSVHGLVAAVAMWLAFVPPARYRSWIERRGRRASGEVPSASA